MRVQLTHNFTDYTRALYMSAFRTKSHLAHLMQNSSLYWLQAIARIGQRT